MTGMITPGMPIVNLLTAAERDLRSKILYPKPLNPKPLNPKPLNPTALKPQHVNPKPQTLKRGPRVGFPDLPQKKGCNSAA